MTKCDSTATPHYHLVCKTCNVELLPVVATNPGEMLSPQSDGESCECCGQSQPTDGLIDSIRGFHREHDGHELIERECKGS